jgi:ribosomal protein L32
MAATPKHRRSSSKARSTRASNRYDVTLTKFKKMKKKGGKSFTVSKETGLAGLSHRVSKDNPTYKGIKVMDEK